MAKKYLKNENGIVRAVMSDNLQLEKPLLNENYDIEVHNRNMDKIDSAIQEVKGKIDGLELVASNVKMADGTTVEDTVSRNKINISNNTNLANQALDKANEAFQRGDNVKTQLVDKLISEGQNVSTNNTFEELIDGIALGKRTASGTYSPSSSTNTMVVPTNLNYNYDVYATLGGYMVTANGSSGFSISNFTISNKFKTTGSSTNLPVYNCSIINLTKSSFSIKNESSGHKFTTSATVTWFAIER